MSTQLGSSVNPVPSSLPTSSLPDDFASELPPPPSGGTWGSAYYFFEGASDPAVPPPPPPGASTSATETSVTMMDIGPPPPDPITQIAGTWWSKPVLPTGTEGLPPKAEYVVRPVDVYWKSQEDMDQNQPLRKFTALDKAFRDELSATVTEFWRSFLPDLPEACEVEGISGADWADLAGQMISTAGAVSTQERPCLSIRPAANATNTLSSDGTQHMELEAGFHTQRVTDSPAEDTRCVVGTLYLERAPHTNDAGAEVSDRNRSNPWVLKRIVAVNPLAPPAFDSDDEFTDMTVQMTAA
ncbi:uncharacterized protein MKK02DRAFT_41765 [Dioszegia hungarica]|uniref:Uncharacterized protein n=1 Tax=Dioszegia hungarica TaxID=4972 RepID=A0AA38HDI0_9TREE|nr:uncharacterized protein MKK02DRAFT_41765 [Dioszegia hungarica]KAI9638740.1 hypothetical protein MKK02DRAFT_41765 [Dioszegia hungarica]